MANDIRLDLLLKEIKDEYVQENFRKLKRYLDCIEAKIENAGGGSGGGDTTIINNNINNSPWDEIVSVVLPASSTTVVSSIPLANTVCGEFKVCLMEQGGTKTKTFNLRYRKTDTDVKDQVYAISGDVMNISVFAVRTLTAIELQITNNELYVIEADFTKINA